MAPTNRTTLRVYGHPSDAPPLDWAWVDGELVASLTYWTMPAGEGQAHPRPVWGLWHYDCLHLSIGSQVIARVATPGAPISVHLDSGVDVVIIEGRVVGPATDAGVIELYNAKYEWNYTPDEYGPLTVIAPLRILAWRAGGWAGRDSFQQAGRWDFAR